MERAEEAARVEQAARAERVARRHSTAPKPAHSFKLNSEEPGLPTREHPREYALEYSMARPIRSFIGLAPQSRVAWPRCVMWPRIPLACAFTYRCDHRR